MNDQPVMVTAEQLAALFGVTPRTIRLYAQDAILPREGPGRYPLLKCVTSYINYLHQTGPRPGRAGLADQRLRLLTARADKAEFEHSQLQLYAVSTQTVYALWRDMKQAIATALKSQPPLMANAVLGKLERDYQTIVEVLDQHINELLRELADKQISID